MKFKMNEVFDITPIPYVGNNKHYRDLSTDELEKLKNVDVKANPTSNEIQENVVVNLLPQVGLTTENNEPNVEDILSDVEADEKENLLDTEEIDVKPLDEEFDLLKESLNDEVNGLDTYLESSKFIDTLKAKFTKKDSTESKEIAYNKIMKAAKVYIDLKFIEARKKLAIVKDPSLKNSIMIKRYQKKAILAEKDFRKLKALLTDEEIAILNQYIEDFNSNFTDKIQMQIDDIEDAKKAAIKTEYAQYTTDVNILNFITESVNDDFYLEGVNWDLHKKYREDLGSARKKVLECGKSIRRHDYDSARLILNTAIEEILVCKESALKEIDKIDDSKIITAICGLFLRTVTILFRDILLIILPFGGPIAGIRVLIDNIKDSSNISRKYQEKGYFVPGDFNTYVEFVKKDYDRIIHILKVFASKIDDIENRYKEKHGVNTKESCKTEGCESKIVTEKNIDPDMKPIIDKLHSKGYKTIASSSGHKNVITNNDGDRDNIRDGHHYGDARLVFDGKYNLGKAPKYWYWKKVENGDKVDYLDIMQIKGDEWPNDGDKFTAWKTEYMKSLTNWVDSLPNVSSTNVDVEEACCKESVDDQDYLNAQITALQTQIYRNEKLQSEWMATHGEENPSLLEQHDKLCDKMDELTRKRRTGVIESSNSINDDIDTLYESVIGSLMLDVMDI